MRHIRPCPPAPIRPTRAFVLLAGRRFALGRNAGCERVAPALEIAPRAAYTEDFTVEQVVELVRAGLASVTSERVVVTGELRPANRAQV